MAPDPSQEDIQQVIEVIGCDRDQAFRYLKVRLPCEEGGVAARVA